jgi:hypothetical protein
MKRVIILAGACYYHASPYGSGPPIWGCDLGTFPDPPAWLVQAIGVLALLGLAIGVLTVVLGRNPLPWARWPRSPVAIRVQGLSEIVGSILLFASTLAVAQSRGDQPAELGLALIPLIGFPVMAGLWVLVWYLDRRSPRHPSAA